MTRQQAIDAMMEIYKQNYQAEGEVFNEEETKDILHKMSDKELKSEYFSHHQYELNFI